MLLSDKLTNLKELSFGIYHLCDNIKVGKSIVNIIRFLLNRFKELTSLEIFFRGSTVDKRDLSDRIKVKLDKNPLNRPHRLHSYSSGGIHIWMIN